MNHTCTCRWVGVAYLLNVTIMDGSQTIKFVKVSPSKVSRCITMVCIVFLKNLYPWRVRVISLGTEIAGITSYK